MLPFWRKNKEVPVGKFLVVGLGNPGDDYCNTRHNIGWMVADALAQEAGVSFADRRYGFVAEMSLRGRKIIILKPTTYMNLSGNAVRYWLQKAKVPMEHLLVIVDDIALEVGVRRLKGSGSAGTHNGLRHIEQLLGDGYARLRIGIGSSFLRGQQIAYVLGTFSPEEQEVIAASIKDAVAEVESFILNGVDYTMNAYNRKH